MAVEMQPGEREIARLAFPPDGAVCVTDRRVFGNYVSKVVGVIPAGRRTDVAELGAIDSASVGERRHPLFLVAGGIVALLALVTLSGAGRAGGVFFGLAVVAAYWLCKHETLVLTVSGRPFVVLNLARIGGRTAADQFVNSLFEAKSAASAEN